MKAESNKLMEQQFGMALISINSFVSDFQLTIIKYYLLRSWMVGLPRGLTSNTINNTIYIHNKQSDGFRRCVLRCFKTLYFSTAKFLQLPVPALFPCVSQEFCPSVQRNSGIFHSQIPNLQISLCFHTISYKGLPIAKS